MSEPEYLTRRSPFAYQCNQCSRCCRHYSIKVNPYEIARLAANLEITTTEFIARYTTDQGTVLKRERDNACVFLRERGCSVHHDRPLVCRLYPLGRTDTQADGERFQRLDLVAGSLGVFADPENAQADQPSAVVQNYLDGQGADPYIAAVDEYNRLLVLMLRKLDQMDSDKAGADDAAEPLMLMDMDAFLASEGRTEPDSPDAKMRAHINGIRAWLAR